MEITQFKTLLERPEMLDICVILLHGKKVRSTELISQIQQYYNFSAATIVRRLQQLVTAKILLKKTYSHKHVYYQLHPKFLRKFKRFLQLSECKNETKVDNRLIIVYKGFQSFYQMTQALRF